jgi:hypothetical protein
MAPDQGLLSCAGPPFPRAALEADPVPLESTSPEVDALRRALDGPPFAAYDQQPREWRQLGRSADEVAFGAGAPPVLGGYVVLHREGDAWKYSQSGSSCVVQPYQEGRTMARWGLDPEATAIDPSSTEFSVVVNDSSCAGGVSPDARLDEPVIEETADAVTVTFTSRPPEGAQTCPSHPPVRRTVHLPSPVGERALRDGGLYPPQPPCRVERGDCVNVREEFPSQF